MASSKKVNKFRRKIMKSLTRKLGKTHVPQLGDLNDLKDVKRVLIVRTNHRLGNLLLITPLVQEVMQTFPNAKIDLIVQGFLGPNIFKNYNAVEHIIVLPKKPFKNLKEYLIRAKSIRRYKYDFAINAVIGSSSGRLYTRMANAKFKVFGEEGQDFSKSNDDGLHIAKEQVYAFRAYMQQLGFLKQHESIPNLSINLTHEEIQNGLDKLKELTDTTKKTISIFTFATGSKCYLPDWWNPFYKRLQLEYPDYNIVEVLPYENVSQIDFKAPSFYSKDIREIAAFISHTDLWIGADCGIMHLASASGVPVVGLFSRTNKHVYGPFNGNSISLHTRDLTNDDIINAIDGIIK
ncbi:glycosyltransferase family 9 protein [Nonlabens mediterrranea]|uniref:Glycosyltransferase family 9 protein n=1 Tax=Nonlabens mediterrranea TaxID=1419947 RepID=A0ABS0A1C3_9FLAO|nr:glycosyltransferase family 9 protein [Nonlabens mediterrranea]